MSPISVITMVTHSTGVRSNRRLRSFSWGMSRQSDNKELKRTQCLRAADRLNSESRIEKEAGVEMEWPAALPVRVARPRLSSEHLRPSLSLFTIKQLYLHLTVNFTQH